VREDHSPTSIGKYRLAKGGPTGLAGLLRERTQALHGLAERSGFIQALLAGRATRAGYALYLRNLLPAYQSMEAALDLHRERAGVGALARPELYRATSIVADLRALAGADWAMTLALLPEAQCYRKRVAAAAQGDGIRLIAHAYTRYFGDLNGGRILKKVLSRSLNLSHDCLCFYDYPGIADRHSFLARYRDVLNQAATPDAVAVVLEEACAVFQLNIGLSSAVQAAAAQAPAKARGSRTGRSCPGSF